MESNEPSDMDKIMAINECGGTYGRDSQGIEWHNFNLPNDTIDHISERMDNGHPATVYMQITHNDHIEIYIYGGSIRGIKINQNETIFLD